MSYTAEIIEDSISEEGKRITTYRLVYPRYIHAELLTHRQFSKNSSSSRAIPVNKMTDLAIQELVEPIRYGKNQAGMQAKDENLSEQETHDAKAIWKAMAEFCADGVKKLASIGLAKQWSNRPTEWFSNIRVVLTTTEIDNWDELRNHKDAQPEIKRLAEVMIEARNTSTPKLLKTGEWHLPFITQDERDSIKDVWLLCKISAARACRVSYLKHDGTQSTTEEDLALYDRLVGSKPRHWSPLEHQATPLVKHRVEGDSVKNVPTLFSSWERGVTHVTKDGRMGSGNFFGFIQYRQVAAESFND